MNCNDSFARVEAANQMRITGFRNVVYRAVFLMSP
jgi:hypothetical protein